MINPANLQTRIRPNCRPQSDGSYALDETRPNHFMTEGGNLVIVGKLPNTRYTVSYPGQLRILNRRVNACGILRVRETDTINFNQSILLPTTSAFHKPRRWNAIEASSTCPSPGPIFLRRRSQAVR